MAWYTFDWDDSVIDKQVTQSFSSIKRYRRWIFTLYIKAGKHSTSYELYLPFNFFVGWTKNES